MPVSNLEATDATRLFEMWFEQHLFNDKLAIKIGQLAADAEFILSEGGGYFLNGTWGWPSIAAADLPSGGPAYPLATPGVRVAINPNDKMGLMVGVYNGDPAPPLPRARPAGLQPPRPRLRARRSAAADGRGHLQLQSRTGLAGTVKIGGWNHFGTFEHQRFDSGGALIAVTGNPGRRSTTTGAFTASSTS